MDELEKRLIEIENAIRKLKVSAKNRRIQERRTLSHITSEQRVYNQTGKIVDQTSRDVERIKDELREHDKMLRNNGSGLMFRVRDLETRQQTWREWLAMAIAIGSLLYSIFGK